jgi:hypothetical protein
MLGDGKTLALLTVMRTATAVSLLFCMPASVHAR